MTTQTQLDQRYGRAPSPARRRTRWMIAGACAIVAVGVLAWFTVAGSVDSVDADGLGMQVVDDRTVVVDFQVTGPTDRTIACALEALDQEFGVVGWRIVEYPASGEHSRAFRETIPTVGPATTGLVNSCWVT